MIAHFIVLILYNGAVGPHKVLVKAKQKFDKGNPVSYLSASMTKTVLATVKKADQLERTSGRKTKTKEKTMNDLESFDWDRALEFAEKRADKYRHRVDTWYFDFGMFVVMMLLVGVITMAWYAPDDGETSARAGLSTALM
jgi:hypothetical protein